MRVLKRLFGCRRFSFLGRDFERLLLLFAVSFAVLAPLFCARTCVFSRYFRIFNDGKVIQQAVIRQQRHLGRLADSYLASLDAEENVAFYNQTIEADGENLLLILVITAPRKDENYLRRTLAELDKQIKSIDENGSRVTPGLLVCEVRPFVGNGSGGNDSDDSDDDDEEKEFRAQLKESMQAMRRKFLFFTPENDGNGSRQANIRHKETRDYVLCLTQALETRSSEFLLVLEDDAEPLNGSIETILKLIDYNPWPSDDWCLTKLFFPDKLQGFAVDNFQSILELVVLSVFLGTFVTVLVTKESKSSTRKRYALLLVASFLCGLQLVFIGRQHSVLPLWAKIAPFALEPVPASNTQAMLYPSKRLPHLLSYLSDPRSRNENNKSHIDLMLSTYLQNGTNSTGHLLSYTKLFSHVGYQSSLHEKHRPPHPFYLPELGLMGADNEDQT